MDMSLQAQNTAYSAKLIQGPPVGTMGGREIWNILALFCWHTLHLTFIVIAYIATIIDKSWSMLFAKGSLEKSRVSKALQRKKPRIVGVVIESEEVEAEMSKVCNLLMWLADIGVQHVSLYDMEGLLKQSKRSLEKTLGNLNTQIQLVSTWEEHEKWTSESQITEQPIMTVELLSIYDGKEGIAKAARYLCTNTLQKINSDGQHIDLRLTEADINRGLEAAGCAGPEPDLLLVFGFTRCLLGFPAWRLPFTEIIYMGMLKSLTLDSLLNAVDEFSTKNQRYGK